MSQDRYGRHPLRVRLFLQACRAGESEANTLHSVTTVSANDYLGWRRGARTGSRSSSRRLGGRLSQQRGDDDEDGDARGRREKELLHMIRPRNNGADLQSRSLTEDPELVGAELTRNQALSGKSYITIQLTRLAAT